jgi:hypothetical protein
MHQRPYFIGMNAAQRGFRADNAARVTLPCYDLDILLDIQRTLP